MLLNGLLRRARDGTVVLHRDGRGRSDRNQRPASPYVLGDPSAVRISRLNTYWHEIGVFHD